MPETTVNGYNIDTPEGARQYLISEGIDPDEEVKKGLAFIRKTLLEEMNKLQVKIDEVENKEPSDGIAYIKQLESLEAKMLNLQLMYKDFETKYP